MWVVGVWKRGAAAYPHTHTGELAEGKPLVLAAGHYCSCEHKTQIWSCAIGLLYLEHRVWPSSEMKASCWGWRASERRGCLRFCPLKVIIITKYCFPGAERMTCFCLFFWSGGSRCSPNVIVYASSCFFYCPDLSPADNLSTNLDKLPLLRWLLTFTPPLKAVMHVQGFPPTLFPRTSCNYRLNI